MLDIGICGKAHETVDKHNGCANFSGKQYGRIDKKTAALTALKDNIDLLAEIKQILEEDNEEVLEELFLKLKEKKRDGFR